VNFYSYAPNTGMQFHHTGKEAKETADKALRTLVHNLVTAPDVLETVTWGEVTERAAATGEVGYALKRQDRLSYEAQYPQVIDGRMPDVDGNLFAIKNIHDADLLEHDTVLSIAAIWEGLHGKMARFKRYCFEDVTTFVDLLFEKYKVKRGGTEGNMSFTTFDRRWKLVIGIQKTIDFGPEIEVAKVKMLQAAKEMSRDDDTDLETLVTATYTQIDGKLRVAEILRLCTHKINNATWNEAVEIARAAIEVIGKKKQIRLYKRSDQGQYDAVPLNISAL
jgi:hypothetical protein